MWQDDDSANNDFAWAPTWLPLTALPRTPVSSQEPSAIAPSAREGEDPDQTASPTPIAAEPIGNFASSRDTFGNGLLPLPRGPPGLSTLSPSTSTHTRNTSSGHGHMPPGVAKPSGTIKTVTILPNPDRTVKRELRGSHLFMITINATLGTGLYWRSGQILQLGGPLVVLLSFLLIGFLAWAVMQCITEMLCIWPVPGALSVYVSEFVDAELGIAVGIWYWFTYSVSFAAIIATAAAEVHFWTGSDKTIDGTIMFLIVPLVLTLLNTFDVKIYGWIELATGSLKIFLLGVIIIFLIAISAGVHDSPGARTSHWSDLLNSYDKIAAPDWISAFLMSVSTVAFSYVGIEIVAASALEVRWPKNFDRTRSDSSQRAQASALIGKTFRWSSIWIPVLVCLAYTLSGVLISFNISRDDCSLPRFMWAPNEFCESVKPKPTSSSAFVAIAKESGIPHLDNVFNAFLVFTALTCAMTNLYVASRSMFGLATRLDRGPGQPLVLRILAWFGKTNRHKVPMRAMIFSSLAFIWIPFLNLLSSDAPQNTQYQSTDNQNSDEQSSAISTFVEVLGNMGTAGVFIVWASECFAFLRFYYCIKQHRAALKDARVPQVRRWDYDDHDYPYRSHGQPFTAYMGLAGCLLLLIVCNMAYLWKQPKFHLEPFLSSYLLIFVFLLLWISLKLFRGARWTFVDLSDSKRVIQKIKNLHDLRQGAM